MSKYIIVSGIDGSGKTTIINALQEALQGQGYSVSYIWMRYSHYLLKCMNALARVLGLSVKVHNAMGDVWEHRLYKNRLFCRVYVWCSYIDNWLARRKVTTLRSDFVICDRWVNDILVDLGAECRLMDILDSKWYGRFLRLLPTDNIQLVVIRNKQAVLDCRVENHTNPDFAARYALYQQLAQKPEVTVVDNNGSVDAAVKGILGHIKK